MECIIKAYWWKKQEIDQRFVKKKILHKNYYKKVHAVGMYLHFLLVFP